MREINKIILHCSDSDLPTQNRAMINEWHLKRGWIAIGYHWLILFDGMIEQGRPEEQIGAHTALHNHDSIGICLTGRTNFKSAQFRSLEALLGPMKKRYPKATLHGHCEFNDGKTCPIFDYDPFVKFWNNLSPEGEPMEEA